jgi:hypothetical protein
MDNSVMRAAEVTEVIPDEWFERFDTVNHIYEFAGGVVNNMYSIAEMAFDLFFK